MAKIYNSRFLKSVDGERNYKLSRYDREDLRAPASIESFTATPDTGAEPLEVTFSVDYTEASKWAGSTSVFIHTDDAVVIEGDEGTHEYAVADTYVAQAQALDGLGRVASADAEITVTEL